MSSEASECPDCKRKPNLHVEGDLVVVYCKGCGHRETGKTNMEVKTKWDNWAGAYSDKYKRQALSKEAKAWIRERSRPSS